MNSIYSSNTYILQDERYDYCWLVDIGDYEQVADALPPNTKIRGLFLTHTHFDHIYGINELHKAHPECIIYTSEYGKNALFDDRKNFSRYHEAALIYDGDNVCVLGDNATIELFPGTILETHYTPGHCPSCLSFVMDCYTFTGDSYIPGLKVVTNLPKSDKNLAALSKEKLMIISRNKIICPGHGVVCKELDATFI